MTHWKVHLALAAAFVVPMGVVAVVVPHSFSNNSVADADEVNANFAALATAVTATETKTSGSLFCGFGGSWCPAGYACQSNACIPGTGETQATAATSCQQIFTAKPTATSRAYWLNPTDGPATGAFEAYCLMLPGNGGWTMVAKVVGNDADTLLYDAWLNATRGVTGDLRTMLGADVLYATYATVAGSELLFYDDTTPCGADKRLLQTSSLLGGVTLHAYLTTLPVALDNASTATNLTTPAYRNTGCVHPFNPSGSAGAVLPSGKFGINIRANETAGAKIRFTTTRNSYDAGISSNAYLGGWDTGDLDVSSDGTDHWAGHTVTVFVR